MILIALAIAIWIACGVLAYGLTLGYFMGEFADRVFTYRGEPATPLCSERRRRNIFNETILLAIIEGIVGPIGLAIAFFCSDRGKHGLRYRFYPFPVEKLNQKEENTDGTLCFLESESRRNSWQ